MLKVLTAIVARNGTIGQSWAWCPSCCDEEGIQIRNDPFRICQQCDGDLTVTAHSRPWTGKYLDYTHHSLAMTKGHTIIVGATTSAMHQMPRSVIGKRLVVVTKNTVRAAAYFSGDVGYARSLRAAIWLAEERREDESGAAYAYRMIEGKIFFAGGAQLFAEGLSLADELELTLIDRDWTGDVKFPGWTTEGPHGQRGHLDKIAHESLPRWECISHHRSEVDKDLVFTSWRRK